MTDLAIQPVRNDEAARLVEVWEASVRATHHFLSEADIQFFKPLVEDGVFGLPRLLGVRDAEGRLLAFLGVADDRMEALFVHPDARGTGIGRRLAQYAIAELGVRAVDVNEQNDQAVGFYRLLGFEVVGRSDLDGTGKPFPLLHMRLPG